MTQTFVGFDRITCDPDILGGKPCIRGMRLTVKRVLEIAAQGLSSADLQHNYPELEPEDLLQARAFAARTTRGSREAPTWRSRRGSVSE